MLTPIIERVRLYDTRRGDIRFLDWNLVQTRLGAMIEPRALSEVPVEDGVNITNFDEENNAITAMREINEDKFFSIYNHSGKQITSDVSI